MVDRTKPDPSRPDIGIEVLAAMAVVTAHHPEPLAKMQVLSSFGAMGLSQAFVHAYREKGVDTAAKLFHEILIRIGSQIQEETGVEMQMVQLDLSGDDDATD